MTEQRTQRKTAIFSWSLYDFADTIFSMNIVSRYFPLWIALDMGAKDWAYPLALAVSMFAVALSSPTLGALSDRAQKRKPLLIASSVGCALATALLGFGGSAFLALSIFVFANYFYNIALVFYNALLDNVSTEENRAFVSGLGTALGYLGTIAGLAFTWPYISANAYGAMPDIFQKLIDKTSLLLFADAEAIHRVNSFLPTAVLYFLFALPCFIFVRESALSDKTKNVRPEEKPALSGKPEKLDFKTLFSSLLKNPRAFRFLVANFLLLDTVHTVIAFMAVYASGAIGMKEDAMNFFFIASTIFALAGSFFYGWLIKRASSHFGMQLCFANWAAVLALAIFAPSIEVFWFVGPLAGIGLGGVWTVARVYLMEIVPKEELGKYFGFYTLSGKCAAIAGPVIWGTVMFLFENFGAIKYRIALAVLSALLIAGWSVFLRVKK